ncbi:MAG: hypothetical protein E7437_07385 [Ruminococcaceae bacterium]|nr:hypothetical protein [Oscillospiraceae bacterium]
MINILMLGGKRCGKTTVLASMFDEVNRALAGTNVSLMVDNANVASLRQARWGIQQKMQEFNTPLTRIQVDDNATDAMKTYFFDLVSGNSVVKFQIHDVPGEWLTDGHEAQVQQLIKDCQVILIAIDTPYLFAKMTGNGYGLYHEEYNKPQEITNLFKNTLSTLPVTDRMVLFVPIKCERYYHLTHCKELNINHRNYMNEIVEAISYGYNDLLMYLRSSAELESKTTMAITPILSAGGIDFVKFCEDPETGRMVSLYQEPEFLDKSEKGYQPKFCEQPLVYALSFILMDAWVQSKNGQSNNFFKGGASNTQLLQQMMDTMRRKMKKNTGSFADDGYYFIQNPRFL